MSTAHDKLREACLSAATEILTECTEILASDQTIQNDSAQPKLDRKEGHEVADCGDALVQLLARQASVVRDIFSHDGKHPDSSADDKKQAARLHLARKRLDDLLATAYARFYAYLYSALPLCWRVLYTDASILKFSLLFLSQQQSQSPPLLPGAPAPSEEDKNQALDEMIKTLDMAIILAGAAGTIRGRAWIDAAFDLLEEASQSQSSSSSSTRHSTTTPPWESSSSPSFSPHEPFTPPVTHPIRRIPSSCLSLSAFQSHLDTPSGPSGPEPLIITNLTSTWPAATTNPWHKPSYLLSRTFSGRRLVPIEIGRSYTDANWTQRILPFHTFLSQYITSSSSSSSSSEKGYLAQYSLLAQLPQLRKDILIPDYVYTTPPPKMEEGEGMELDEPIINAWFGPAGTITPLHTDVWHNILVMVVGRKYVRLYAPGETERLKPMGRTEGGVEMGNTSSVDVGRVEGWDCKEEEEGEGEEKGEEDDIKQAEFVDCILEDGDGLYIPAGWWHYVRGLSVSFGVSFWWN
ncbi:hypothetical protein QBC47DRAFT_101516 [Echria macrotheca]|uniref:JmjC domain-containing protein n=1 Tax=Echria macrotheca TaxID=438768 RepID=A0AAJ0BJ84_9PEZI|nr:hypothetical protein QBC47DRAFT_101516 [Echria macrotheca]